MRLLVFCDPFKAFKEAVLNTFGFVSGESVQTDGVQSAENAFLNIGIGLPERFDQLLGFCTLAVAAAIAVYFCFFGKAAGALNKSQLIVTAPGNDVFLVDAI